MVTSLTEAQVNGAAPAADVPSSSLAQQWKESFAPRTWADPFFDIMFPEGEPITVSDLLVMRHNLLLLGELRLQNFQDAYKASADAPEYVQLALVQMAASSTTPAKNRDGADIGTLVELIDRALDRPLPNLRI